jgi:hypothetical protein
MSIAMAGQTSLDSHGLLAYTVARNQKDSVFTTEAQSSQREDLVEPLRTSFLRKQESRRFLEKSLDSGSSPE